MRAPARKQHGVAALMAVLFLLFMLGVVLVIANQMAATDVHDSGAQNLSVSALFLAESAVERASRRFSAGTACAALAETVSNPFGAGATTSFAILATPAPTMVAGRCRLSARGTIGNIARTIVVDLQPGALTLFSEHFEGSIAPWTQVLSPAPNNQGLSIYDFTSNCPASICTSTVPGSGSLGALTPSSTSNQRLTGYRWRTLPTALTTGSGLTIDTFLGYAKHAANGNPRTATVRILLEDTAGGVTTVIWTDPAPLTAPACSPAPPPAPTSCWVGGTQTVALPAGRTYDRIRLFFDLEERGTNRVIAWFDAVAISSSGGSVTLTRWTEL